MINVGVKALSGDSPSIQRKVGSAVASAFNAQARVGSSNGTLPWLNSAQNDGLGRVAPTGRSEWSGHGDKR